MTISRRIFSIAASFALLACGGDLAPDATRGINDVQTKPILQIAEVVSFSQAYADYTLRKEGNSFVVIRNDGWSYVAGPYIKRLSFSDGTLALDTEGNSGQVYRLYQASFNRLPDLEGLGYWINVLDRGSALETVAANFIQSSEFALRYGSNANNSQFVSSLYSNALHRQPDAEGFSYWLQLLDANRLSRAQVLMYFSESVENKANADSAIRNGIFYRPYPGSVSPPSPIDTPNTRPLTLNINFNRPTAIASDNQGALYVADHGTVRKISAGGIVVTLAGMPGDFAHGGGQRDGVGTEARLSGEITSLTVASDGSVYFLEGSASSDKIRRITPSQAVSTLNNTIHGKGITADGRGNIWLTNTIHGEVLHLTPQSDLTLVARVLGPKGLTVDNAGNLIVMNTGNEYGPRSQNSWPCTVVRINPVGQADIIAGREAGPFETTCQSTDGQGANARIGGGSVGITEGADGTIYFADVISHTIRKITRDGAVSTVAGRYGIPGYADGAGVEAQFNRPLGITMGRDGNLYVADTDNHALRIVSPDGAVRTYAGHPARPR